MNNQHTPSPAWQRGYDDARTGKPESAQVAPDELSEYRDGHTAGQYVNRRTGSTILLFGAVDVDVLPLEGDPAVARWIADGAPVSGATWSGDFSDVDGNGEIRLTLAAN